MRSFQAPANMLQNQVIMITGAGSGIGRAVALACARLGATVVLMGRTIEKLEAVYDEIEACGYPKPAIIPLNLLTATHLEYAQIADIVEKELGHLNALIHCAAQLGELTMLSQYPMDTFANVIKVNMTASLALTQALLPLLQEAPSGRIIFTTSSVGRKGRAHWGAYAISKFAVEGLVQTLADELENTSSIRVNAINPGATRTNMRASAYPAEDPAKVCPPEKVAETFLYLLSEDARHMHGLSIDAQD
ncbi:Short-chain dehydrogenase/reductase SDR [gamma proteobacterium HdN1]|nr:Short-chain dehydrogenase/reductase SDR [gamma proteobacterium HdN1]